MENYWTTLAASLVGGAVGSSAIGALIMLLLKHRLDRHMEELKGDIDVDSDKRKRRNESIEETSREVLEKLHELHDFVMKGLNTAPSGDTSLLKRVGAYHLEAVEKLNALRTLARTARVDVGSDPVIALLTYINTVSVCLNDLSIAVLQISDLAKSNLDIQAAEISGAFFETIQTPLLGNSSYEFAVTALRDIARGKMERVSSQ